MGRRIVTLTAFIAVLVFTMLGVRDAGTIADSRKNVTKEVSAASDDKTIKGVHEIKVVTVPPVKSDTEDINFDLRNLSIVRKGTESNEHGISSASAVGEDSEQPVESESELGTDSDSDGESGLEDSGTDEPDGDTGSEWSETEDYVSEDGDGEPMSELVESEFGEQSDDSNEQYGYSEYSEDTDNGWSDGYTDESDGEEGLSEDDGWVYYANARITHFCPCSQCCGVWASGYTASGSLATEGRTVASGEDLPFGTEVLINDQVYIVEDRGVEPGQLDIFVSDHEKALAMGMYYTDVYVRYP